MTAAKKQESKATPTASQPQPQQAATTTPKAEVVSKQQITVNRLKEAWTKRGVDLSKMEVKDDGKFKLITVGPGWPVIVIGAAGGIDIPSIKSFPKAFEAAVEGDKLLAKQLAREVKKTAAPKPAAPAPAPEAKKPETPGGRKERQHKQIEAQMA
jgi:hypothetical protein